MTVLAGRYELHQLLGSGGMADVHAALDRQLGRRVAVKLVHKDLVADDRARQRLLQEARSAASFHHPNTVAVFDAGEDQQQPFIVMELVDGQSLLERLQQQGRLDCAETMRIGISVLAALEAAHERGLVHRDVKPANVLLPRRGGAKLADFGIAKAVADTAGNLTSPGEVMGTPKYLSPEQAAGRTAVPASDLYALGVVLYECLAGKPPFTAGSAVALALAHQREAVPPLHRAAPGLPAGLAQVVETALAKEPTGRFADAAAMRRALEAVAEPATPPTARGRAGAGATLPLSPGRPAAGRSRPSAPARSAHQQHGARPLDQPPPARRRRGTRRGVLAAALLVALASLVAAALLQLGPALVLGPGTGTGTVDGASEQEPSDDEPGGPAVEEAPPTPDPITDAPPHDQTDEESPQDATPAPDAPAGQNGG